MDYGIIKDLLPTITALVGTGIGFCGAIYQSRKAFEHEKQMLLLKDRKAVYLEVLEFIQDYQQHKKTNKQYDFSNEELHSRLYCLLAKINIYGSTAIIKSFNLAKKNIESNKDDKEFTKLAEAIRKDLEIK